MNSGLEVFLSRCSPVSPYATYQDGYISRLYTRDAVVGLIIWWRNKAHKIKNTS
jgi:hypothetical protein